MYKFDHPFGLDIVHKPEFWTHNRSQFEKSSFLPKLNLLWIFRDANQYEHNYHWGMAAILRIGVSSYFVTAPSF